MNETIGIPLGIITGLLVSTLAFYHDTMVPREWVYAALLLFACSLVMWYVADKRLKAILKAGKKQAKH